MFMMNDNDDCDYDCIEYNNDGEAYIYDGN